MSTNQIIAAIIMLIILMGALYSILIYYVWFAVLKHRVGHVEDRISELERVWLKS